MKGILPVTEFDQNLAVTHTYLLIEPIVKSSVFDVGVFTVDIICEYYAITKRTVRELIVSGLNELVKRKLITKKKELYIASKEIYIMKDNEYFITVPIEGIIKLANDPQLLKYFVILIRYIKLESLSLSYLSEKTGKSIRTICRYNEELEQMKLLYIKRSSYSEDGRPVNKYSLTPFTNNTDKDLGNFRRSVSAKYNSFIKRGADYYTKEEIQELYDMCVKYNNQVSVSKRKELDKIRELL